MENRHGHQGTKEECTLQPWERKVVRSNLWMQPSLQKLGCCLWFCYCAHVYILSITPSLFTVNHRCKMTLFTKLVSLYVIYSY